MNISHYITDLQLDFKQQLEHKDKEIEKLKIKIYELQPKTTVTIPRKVFTTQEEIIEQLKTTMA